MNHLGKNHHFNVDVRKWGSNFVKCIVCESLKDLILKIERNGVGASEHEIKLRKHNIHRESCRCLYHIWNNQSNQEKSTCASFMTR